MLTFLAASLDASYEIKNIHRSQQATRAKKTKGKGILTNESFGSNLFIFVFQRFFYLSFGLYIFCWIVFSYAKTWNHCVSQCFGRVTKVL